MIDFIIDAFITLIYITISAFIALTLNELKWEQEAVARGHAEYILNPDTGETKWQWKNQPKGEE